MRLKEIIEGFYKKDHLLKRSIMVIIAVTVMGFALSFLLLVGWGTDPCTMMNKSIANTVGMSIGNWQAILNIFMLAFVIIFGGTNLGIGTIANMFLVGYSIDFFSWIWKKTLPIYMFDTLWVKLLVFVPALVVFVFAVAVYMDLKLGTSPYDAVPIIIADKLKKVPFTYIRIVYDYFVIGVGMAFGGRLEIGTILMAALLGPVISFVGKRIERFIK